MLSIEKSVLIWELARVQTDWHVSRLIRPSLWTVCHFIRGIFHSAEWILHHFLSVCFVCVSWVAREDVHLRYTLISVSSERRVRGIYGRCPLAADQQGLSPQGPWQVWVCVCVCVCKRERERVYYGSGPVDFSLSDTSCCPPPRLWDQEPTYPATPLSSVSTHICYAWATPPLTDSPLFPRPVGGRSHSLG